jgi:hypothetical protein
LEPRAAFRAIALLLPAVCALAGCYETHIFTPGQYSSQVLESPRETGALDASFVLRDGTKADFSGPKLDGDVVSGRVSSCDGPGCGKILSTRGVAFDDLSQVRVKRFSSGRTAALVAGLVGIAVVTTVVVVLVANNNSNQNPPPPPPSMSGGGGYGVGSCPTAYSWDGHGWRLDSGTFGGSHFPAAQRTDYDLLEYLVPDGGKYRLRLVNELPESEFTDAVGIQVVDHPAGVPVVPDLSGKLLTFRDTKPPLSATDLRGRDALPSVAQRDDTEWKSDVSDRRPDRPEDLRDGLVATFAKPPGVKRAKLWMAAKNTPWSVMMFKNVIAQQGPDLAAWFREMNANADARRRLHDFFVEEGTFTVEVQVGDSWSRRGFFWFIGPEARKDQAIEFPVDDIPGDKVTVRLSAPVAFWTVDSLSLAYGDDDPLQVTTLPLRSAIAEGGRDLTRTLSTIDSDRYATRPGDRAELSFDAPPPPAAGLERSYVLVSTGYYVPDVTPDPHADPKKVAQLMSTPGAPARMSLELLNGFLAREILQGN